MMSGLKNVRVKMNTIQLTWIKISIINHFLWTYAKKIAKFIGRYFLTLLTLWFWTLGIIEGRPIEQIAWKNCLCFLAITLLIDWLKMFAKPITSDSDNLMDHFKTGAIHIDRWYDGGIPGSAAYRTSHMDEKGY